MSIGTKLLTKLQASRHISTGFSMYILLLFQDPIQDPTVLFSHLVSFIISNLRQFLSSKNMKNISLGQQKVKEESEKVGLKLNIQKTKIMASGPITSWQIDGKTVETVADFILGGSKITTDDDCSQEIKRCLFLERKVMTNLDSILKSRDITLSTKVRLVKAMVLK